MKIKFMKIKLYHGSKDGNINSLKKMQAQAGEGVIVPEDELKEGIYLTPDYGFALAMAARPEGLSNIDDEKKVISFENPEGFCPEQEVYVYEVEVDDSQLKKIDELQYLAEDIDNIEVSVKHEHKSKEIENYYKLENLVPKVKNEFKFR